MRPIVTDRISWFVGLHAGRSVTVVIPAKTAQPIEMPFGLRIRVGPRKHVVGGVHTVAAWRIPLNRSRAAAMRPFCQITLTTCYYYYGRSA